MLQILLLLYSWKWFPAIDIQCDGNSFGGDVVLDSVNVLSRNEDNILDKMYVKQIFLEF